MSSICMFLQMAVMEEVQSQMTEITSKQKEKVDELNAEIRKLKVSANLSLFISKLSEFI